MTEHDIRSVADRVLNEHLASLNYQGVDIRFERDQDDEEGIGITAHLGVPAERIASVPMLVVAGAMRQALLDRGEERFPYVSYSYGAEMASNGRP